jgi:hypothetical protein
LHRVIDVINSHPGLEIKFDNSPAALRERADKFRERSDFLVFNFCVGAIDDALAIQIEAPSRVDVQNQSRFYSGSKKTFCLNMQGVCDAKGLFIAVSSKHVGWFHE